MYSDQDTICIIAYIAYIMYHKYFPIRLVYFRNRFPAKCHPHLFHFVDNFPQKILP